MPEALRILVVEDRPNVSELIGRFLAPLAEKFPGLHIETVTTLRDALRVLHTYPCPDLVTLDLALADALPPETLRAVPEIEQICPVLIVTGNKTDGFTEMLEELQVEVIRKGGSWLEDNKFIRAAARALTRGLERENARNQLRLGKMRAITEEFLSASPETPADAS